MATVFAHFSHVSYHVSPPSVNKKKPYEYIVYTFAIFCLIWKHTVFPLRTMHIFSSFTPLSSVLTNMYALRV